MLDNKTHKTHRTRKTFSAKSSSSFISSLKSESLNNLIKDEDNSNTNNGVNKTLTKDLKNYKEKDVQTLLNKKKLSSKSKNKTSTKKGNKLTTHKKNNKRLDDEDTFNSYITYNSFSEEDDFGHDKNSSTEISTNIPPKSKETKKLNQKWRAITNIKDQKNYNDYLNLDFKNNDIPANRANYLKINITEDKSLEPYEYFQLFFTDEFLGSILEYSNTYYNEFKDDYTQSYKLLCPKGRRKQKFQVITLDELKVFLGIKLWMTFNKTSDVAGKLISNNKSMI